MASEVKVDDWTGEAEPDALSAHDEQAMLDAVLAAVERHGVVPPAEAARRLADMRARYPTG